MNEKRRMIAPPLFAKAILHLQCTTSGAILQPFLRQLFQRLTALEYHQQHQTDDHAHSTLHQIAGVVEKGTAREIFKDPRHPYTIGLMKSKPVVGKYTEKLYSIPGSVPNPIDMPNYCYFKDRCEMCVDGCEGAYPLRYQISPTHFVSCYRCAAEAVGKEGDTKNEQ